MGLPPHSSAGSLKMKSLSQGSGAGLNTYRAVKKWKGASRHIRHSLGHGDQRRRPIALIYSWLNWLLSSGPRMAREPLPVETTAWVAACFQSFPRARPTRLGNCLSDTSTAEQGLGAAQAWPWWGGKQPGTGSCWSLPSPTARTSGLKMYGSLSAASCRSGKEQGGEGMWHPEPVCLCFRFNMEMALS